MAADHVFAVRVEWTGNLGEGTSGTRAYSRDHEIGGAGKPVIAGSSAPEFRGDAARYNPEELLVAALSGCHMLWYLHLCAEAGVVVMGYTDEASGTMTVGPGGAGQFTGAVLRPRVVLAAGSGAEAVSKAEKLHERAHELCFIARSVNFEVRWEGVVEVGGG